MDSAIIAALVELAVAVASELSDDK